MFNLIRKDIIVSYSNKLTIIMILLYFPFILFTVGSENTNMLFILSASSSAFIITIIPFVYEIRDKSHILIQSLPITKKDIVMSKYISIFINCGIGILYTGLYMLIFSLIGLINVDKIGISIILSTLGFSILAISISLPMQFRFMSMLANFINMVFYMIIINIIVFGEDVLMKILSFDMTNIYNILGIVGATVMVYFLSMMASIVMYKTRKFY